MGKTGLPDSDHDARYDDEVATTMMTPAAMTHKKHNDSKKDRGSYGVEGDRRQMHRI